MAGLIVSLENCPDLFHTDPETGVHACLWRHILYTGFNTKIYDNITLKNVQNCHIF